MAMKFRTPYTEMKPVYSNPGKRFKVVYEMVYDEKGAKTLTEVGTTDLQAAIASEFASVDLNMIISRFKNGDEEALNRAEAFYADISDLPVTFQEILEMNRQGKKIFEDMPLELRRIYDNDYLQFLSDPARIMVEVEKKREAQKEVAADDHEEQ